ncbi:uncharacterized protein [Phaenicophaeus curvirostris]|uniref:uncharacterized protein isoform X5 n=1 Tax=Phaenicophaeus curvirostris TaxID=33595 RepID=UPI0037F0CBEA
MAASGGSRQRQSDRSVGDERAPAGSRPLLRERGKSDVAVPSRPAAFGPKSQSRECPCCRKPGKSLAAQPRFLKAPYSSTFHPVVRSNVRRPCAGTADLLAKPEGPALGVERLGRSHPSSERRRLRMLPERAEDGLQGRENQSEASGQLDSKWGETLMPGEQRSFHC